MPSGGLSSGEAVRSGAVGCGAAGALITISAASVTVPAMQVVSEVQTPWGGQ